jgi:hypothetical protein
MWGYEVKRVGVYGSNTYMYGKGMVRLIFFKLGMMVILCHRLYPCVIIPFNCVPCSVVSYM